MSTQQDRMKIYMDNKEYTLKRNDSFTFSCNICGECCKNRQDIIISPYDMYRITRYLQISPMEFVEKYCETYIGQESNIPLVVLKFKEIECGSLKYTVCPFVKKKDGLSRCKIQNNKPVVCALFPLGRTSHKDQETGKIVLEYFNQKTNCGGVSTTQTVKEWLSSYGLDDSEQAFLDFNDFLFKVYDTIDLNKHKNDKRIPEVSKNNFYNKMFYEMYINIEREGERLQVLKENYNATIEFIKTYVSFCSSMGINLTPSKK